MTLTPDEVVTKQFQHVRFKEGFDPDEVDDFLDEIVVEWRKTIAENEELKAKNAELLSKISALESAAKNQGSEGPVPAPVSAFNAPAPAAPAKSDTAQSAAIIELAQRVHDEHIAEGKAEHDKYIAEAKSQAASIINAAESKSRDELARLNMERTKLESRISELRQFERDYRNDLRGYIEAQLNELNNSSSKPESK